MYVRSAQAGYNGHKNTFLHNPARKNKNKPRPARKSDDFLERDLERALAQRCRGGDRSAGDQIIIAYQPLARNAARKFCDECAEHREVVLPFEDLVQEASLAMQVAFDTFDPNQSRFSTYVRLPIKWAFTKYLNDYRSDVRRGPNVFKVADVSLNAPEIDCDGRVVERGDLIADN